MDIFNITNSTNSSQSSTILERFYVAGEWIDLFIRILGLITNPLILIVLSRQRIGSKFYSDLVA